MNRGRGWNAQELSGQALRLNSQSTESIANMPFKRGVESSIISAPSPHLELAWSACLFVKRSMRATFCNGRCCYAAHLRRSALYHGRPRLSGVSPRTRLHRSQDTPQSPRSPGRFTLFSANRHPDPQYDLKLRFCRARARTDVSLTADERCAQMT